MDIVEQPVPEHGAHARIVLHQIDEGRPLEDMREQGILDIGSWGAEVLY